MITETEFGALRRQGFNRIPLVLESFADLDTPLSLYLKLANRRYSYLLESVVGGERFGRYSFIGLPAKVRLRARGRQIEVEDEGGVLETIEGDPLAFVESFRARFRAAPLPGLPRFCGGLAGYFGYDTVRHIETKLAHTAKPPDRGPGRRARPAFAADRGTRGRRQPDRQDLAHRLRRSGGARRLCDGTRPPGGAQAQAARAGEHSVRNRIRNQRAVQRIRRSRLQGRGGEGQGVHRGRRRDAGGALAAHVDAFHRFAVVALSRAAIAQSVAVHVLLRLRRLSRGRRVARDPRAQGRRRRSRCVRSPARGRGAIRARPTRCWRRNWRPTPRRSPST